MAHEDECPFNLKSNDQSNNFDLYDTIVKPQNPIKQDAPTADRPNLPIIQNQNAYLLYQQHQYSTAYSPVQQPQIQTPDTSTTYHQQNQKLSFPPSYPNVQEVPTQNYAAIPTYQQPQIQQHTYTSVLHTAQKGLTQATAATSSFQQNKIQQLQQPTEFNPVQQAYIQATVATSIPNQSQIQQPSYLRAQPTVQEIPIQTYAAIQNYQQNQHATAFPPVQQVLAQTTAAIPNYQQNQIQQRQYPHSYPPQQQTQIQGSATILTYQQLQMQQPDLYSQNIQSNSFYNAVQAQQAPAQPIFDFPQQPGQPIFDIPSYNHVPNPVQVLSLNTQVQNQTHQPTAQVQEVQPIYIENEPTQKQGGFQRSLIVREFATVNKHGHLNCFLNVCLQALWQFQWVRRHLLQLCKEGDLGGAQELRPFIESLKKFYQGVLRHDSKVDCSLHEYEALEVRKELFKLYYDKGEFALHGKADASEALDQILGVIHGWLATKQLREKDTFNMFQCSKQKCNQNCFVHQGFFQQQVEVSNCSCGKQSEPLYLDSNLFATTVNTLDLLQTLKNVQSSTDTELAKLSASHQVFMDALKWKMSLKKPNCTDPSTINTDGRHNSSQETWLMNSPEVITLNLQWDGLPSAKDILNILISVPENFDSIKLFNIAQPNVSQKYIFKGMICFQAAHYLCFFRRAPIKFSYIVTQQEFNWDQLWKKMWYESTSEEAEWTLYDDAEIVSKGGWAAVIEQCVEFSCYPTVLFFEKLESEDVDYLNQYQSSHKLSEKQISKLFDLAKDAEGFNDFGSGFSQEEILAQIQLENQFNKDKVINKTDVVEKKPELDQATLKMLRTKYKQYGIFLFPCNQCSDGIQALHVKKCIKPECKGINYFQQINPPPDKVKWRECLAEILAKMKWASNTIQSVKPPESKPIAEPIKSEQIKHTNIEAPKKPEKVIEKPPETVQEQQPVETNPQSIIQDVVVETVQEIKVEDLAQEIQEQVKDPIKNQEDLVGQNKNYDAIDLEIGQKNHMQDPVVTIWPNQQQQIQPNPQSFKGQQEWGMPPQQVILQEPQKPRTEEEIKFDQVKPENQEQIQYPQVNVYDEVNENKEQEIDKETQDLIDKLQKEQVVEVVEEKITLWKCPDCQRTMPLNDKCNLCKKALVDQTVDVEFKEVTKQEYEIVLKNAEEEKSETMWTCPRCKIYMKLEEKCKKCDNEIQYFENSLRIPLESMIVQVKFSDYQDILIKQAKIKVKLVKKETYWMCPRGCTDRKLKFGAKCRVCYEDFMYYVLQKRMRTQEDLFHSDDEPIQFWTCQKCKNHNICINKSCMICKRNKYNHEKQEMKEIREKQKEWHWKCYFCNYTNKYLKIEQCYGCKKYTRSTSKAFEVEYEYKPKTKVDEPKQIEVSKQNQELEEVNPNPAEEAKPVEKLEGFQWQCSCGQMNVVIDGFTCCIKCKCQKPQEQEQKDEQAKFPENTWMCMSCRELNFNEDWVKLSTAYCQTCKKFSEERKQQILVALSKQYKERYCERCKKIVFIKVDQSACDDCIENDGEVQCSADEEVSEKRIVYQPEKKLREQDKSCSVCFAQLKSNETHGFCDFCTQNWQGINQEQNQKKKEQLFDCENCGKRTRKSLEQMCDGCIKRTQQNQCKVCGLDCLNLEICNICNAHSVKHQNNPYQKDEKSKSPRMWQQVKNFFVGKKEENQPKQEIVLQKNEQAQLLCKKCNKVVSCISKGYKNGTKLWICQRQHEISTTF